MKYGKCKFYADENIEEYLIDYLRDRGYKVVSARELGFNGREDKFHLQQARKEKAVLLTKDDDYLDDSMFPYSQLKDTAIIVFSTKDSSGSIDFGYALNNLLSEIGSSGNKNIYGLKLELKGPKIVFHARVRGRVRTDTVDFSVRSEPKNLFEE